MKTTAKEMADLIRAATRMYVGSPDKIEVNPQESQDGAVCFMLKGSAEDDSRLIGRGGCHVKALEFLIEQVGLIEKRTFTFRLISHDGRCDPWIGPHDAISYDPDAARDLLIRWLSALGVEGFTVDAGPGGGPKGSLSYNFNVSVSDTDEAEALTLTLDGRALSIVGALGTLWRAMAKQAGVKFQIRLSDRVVAKTE